VAEMDAEEAKMGADAEVEEALRGGRMTDDEVHARLRKLEVERMKAGRAGAAAGRGADDPLAELKRKLEREGK